MDPQPLNPFAELLAVLNSEDLLRIRRRLEKRGNLKMVQLMSEEIKRREAIWSQEK